MFPTNYHVLGFISGFQQKVYKGRTDLNRGEKKWKDLVERGIPPLAICFLTWMLMSWRVYPWVKWRIISTTPYWTLEEYRLTEDIPKLPLEEDQPQSVKAIKEDLRPISLSPSISKLAEDFVVTEYVKPAVLCMLDPGQFGAIPKSSTTLALLEMLHEWTQGTDGNGATIRTLLFDYKKGFDLTDHNILVRKLCAVSIPPNIINWIIDFLLCRSQRIKLTERCVSE